MENAKNYWIKGMTLVAIKKNPIQKKQINEENKPCSETWSSGVSPVAVAALLSVLRSEVAKGRPPSSLGLPDISLGHRLITISFSLGWAPNYTEWEPNKKQKTRKKKGWEMESGLAQCQQHTSLCIPNNTWENVNSIFDKDTRKVSSCQRSRGKHTQS